MQLILAVITLIASVLGLLFGFLSRRAARGTGKPAIISPALVGLWAALAAVVLFLLTLPTGQPFSPGLRLGWGILIGALFGIIAVARSGNRDEDGMAHAVEMLSLSAFGPALILIAFRGYPNEVLMGFALGAVLAAFGAGALLRPLLAGEEAGSSGSAPGTELFALSTAAIVAGTRLAIGHFPRISVDLSVNRWAGFTHTEVAGGYWAFPALAVATAALVMALVPRDVNEEERPWLPLGVGALGAVAVVILTLIIGAKLLPELRWQPLLYGVIAFGLISAGLIRHGQVGGGTRPLGLAFGAVIFTLAVLIIVFRGKMHGYGEALVLLVGLPIMAAHYLAGKRDSLAASLGTGALTVGLLMVLFRVFLERMDSPWALTFQQQYNLVAALLGASATFGLLAFTGRTMERLQGDPHRGRFSLLASRAALLAIFIGIVPPALAILWGEQAVSAFLAGLIVSQAAWMLLAAWTVGQERAAALAAIPQIPFLLAALVAVQLTRPMLELELTNAVKLVIAVTITVILMIWVAVDGMLRGKEPDALAAETADR